MPVLNALPFNVLPMESSDKKGKLGVGDEGDGENLNGGHQRGDGCQESPLGHVRDVDASGDETGAFGNDEKGVNHEVAVAELGGAKTVSFEQQQELENDRHDVDIEDRDGEKAMVAENQQVENDKHVVEQTQTMPSEQQEVKNDQQDLVAQMMSCEQQEVTNDYQNVPRTEDADEKTMPSDQQEVRNEKQILTRIEQDGAPSEHQEVNNEPENKVPTEQSSEVTGEQDGQQEATNAHQTTSVSMEETKNLKQEESHTEPPVASIAEGQTEGPTLVQQDVSTLANHTKAPIKQQEDALSKKTDHVQPEEATPTDKDDEMEVDGVQIINEAGKKSSGKGLRVKVEDEHDNLPLSVLSKRKFELLQKISPKFRRKITVLISLSHFEDESMTLKQVLELKLALEMKEKEALQVFFAKLLNCPVTFKARQLCFTFTKSAVGSVSYMVDGVQLSTKQQVASKLGFCDGNKKKKRSESTTPSSAPKTKAKPKTKKPEVVSVNSDVKPTQTDQAPTNMMPKVYAGDQKLRKWQVDKISSAADNLRAHTQEYLQEGYTVFRQVLSEDDLNTILHGASGEAKREQQEQDETRSFYKKLHSDSSRVMRRRKGNQQWLGAIKTIHAHIRRKGETETVISPLTTRDVGRYDMPIPTEACSIIENRLKERQLFEFSKHLIRNGKIRTQDIMLSKPGSAQQNPHTDSDWVGRTATDPRIHYLTILIPLTVQDALTGGTRVWPRSHRSSTFDWNKSVDMIEPLIQPGDALVFDGLLTHCGMCNRHDTKDRYFYYAAYSNCHDPNTDVTGA